MTIQFTPIPYSSIDIASRLHHLPNFIWLDTSSPPTDTHHHSIIGVLPLDTATTWTHFQTLTQTVQSFKRTPPIHTPFTTGLLGFLTYESAQNFLTISTHPPKIDSQFPELFFGLYHQVFIFNHIQNTAHYITTHYPNHPAPLTLDDLFTLAKNTPKPSQPLAPHAPATPLISQDQYLQKVTAAKHHIYEGDIYQLNLSYPYQAPISSPPFETYLSLRTQSPVPHGAYINLGHTQILSASPETLFHSDGTHLTTRPIKGTIARGHTPAQDHHNIHTLLNSPKDQAELMMITDLERNDLGKLCEYGSVTVPHLKTLESYSNVHHLVSTITGKLLPTLSIIDILKALFPGGSITGAPKKRAMQLIAQLEPHPRHIYTGSIGYYDIQNTAQFNIAIRTLYTLNSQFRFNTGGGIVADSTPQAEWQETLAKAASILKALTPPQ